ncbi:MarC family protein [Stieleria sp. TO1_6]|uniref:MarC family protein n=1 Tax=Stieleria tagensis TaxID=2956795 RepID=UPI00209B6278|nr:MarC family protein [Stieleria tagensis]MCO8123138.1 MarC family protein [Stieleria tagensis]
MKEQLQAIVTIISLMNPGICAAMFARAIAGQPVAQKTAEATRAALAVLVILVVSALLGTRLLDIFGVSLNAFMVAGGGVLAWMGFGMLSRDPAAAKEKSGSSLTPLILFAASPGTITGVITISAAHTRLGFPVTALIAVAVATTCTWLVMLGVSRFGGQSRGDGFLQDTLTRFMGLIVLAMGVQFALTGFHSFTVRPVEQVENSHHSQPSTVGSEKPTESLTHPSR